MRRFNVKVGLEKLCLCVSRICYLSWSIALKRTNLKEPEEKKDSCGGVGGGSLSELCDIHDLQRYLLRLWQLSATQTKEKINIYVYANFLNPK